MRWSAVLCFDTGSKETTFQPAENHRTGGPYFKTASTSRLAVLPLTRGILFHPPSPLFSRAIKSAPLCCFPQPVKLWQQEAGDGTFGRCPLVWPSCTCDRFDRDLCRAISISLESCMWPVGCTLVTLDCSLCWKETSTVPFYHKTQEHPVKSQACVSSRQATYAIADAISITRRHWRNLKGICLQMAPFNHSLLGSTIRHATEMKLCMRG